MTATANATIAEAEVAGVEPARWWSPVLAVGAVVVTVSPIVVAVLSLAGHPWFPIGDLAHMVFRTSQVGTRDTPLVGTYTVKGWAHPGPLAFWLAAPLYRLTGEDPRALEWTTAAINTACVIGLLTVAWRRGRWPLLLTTAVFVACLIHGLTTEVVVNPWNPFAPLLPFVLTLALAWDAALGHRRALIVAALPASFAMQSHLAFVSLVAVVALWLWAWCRWHPRLLPADDRGRDLPLPPWRPWWGAVWRSLLVAAPLWLGPVIDALFDVHNPITIAKSLATPPASVGPVNAIGLVGRYVRPDGPWIGGAEPQAALSVQGSGALPLLVALVALLVCLDVARRRQLVDVVALVTLSSTLLVAAVFATSQIVLPAYPYLTQWLKIVGWLVWLTVAWTVWRLVEPRVKATSPRQAAVAVAATATLVTATAWSWGDARSIRQPDRIDSAVVQDLRSKLEGRLPLDRRIRVELRGDYFAKAAPGLVYWMIHDGYDVVTRDGYIGLKWGHSHRWQQGDDYDLLVTVAVDEAYQQCTADSRVKPVAASDGLTPDERDWLTRVQLRRLGGPEAVSAEDRRRARQLADRNFRIGVFEGRRPCGRTHPLELVTPTDRGVLPLLGVAGVGLLLAGGAWLRRRQAARTANSE